MNKIIGNQVPEGYQDMMNVRKDLQQNTEKQRKIQLELTRFEQLRDDQAQKTQEFATKFQNLMALAENYDITEEDIDRAPSPVDEDVEKRAGLER